MGIKQGMNSSEGSQQLEITEDEAELYDRQIRLWGLDSQRRLRESRILLVGIGGLGAEVAKNITLAGVKSITVVDNKKVGSEVCVAQFFVAGADADSNRAVSSEASIKKLNPNVEVISDPSNIEEKEDEFFSQFDVICATDCNLSILQRLDNLCRQNGKKFLCGDVWGMYGFTFSDLGHQTYIRETTVSATDCADEPATKRPRLPCPIEKMQTLEFVSLDKALSCKIGKSGIGLRKKTSKVFFLMHILLKFREQHNRYPEPGKRAEDEEILKTLRNSVVESLGFDVSKVSDEDLSQVFGEISPICAIVGGVLAHQIIKAVCADDIPIQNFFLFDGDECLGLVENIGSS